MSLLAALVLALLSELPAIPKELRAHLLQGGSVLFLVVLAAGGPYYAALGAEVRRGPNPLLLALVLWCCVCAALSPYRGFAATELLRVFLCAGVYFAAAYGLTFAEARAAVVALLALGGAVALYGIAQVGSDQAAQRDVITSIFGNHQQFGSFLVLLLPMALAFSLDRDSEPRLTLGAQALVLILAGTLLLTRTRSAWIGGGVSLVVLSALAVRYAPPRLGRADKALLVGPLAVLVVMFVAFVGMSQIGPLVSKRAATFSRINQDFSFGDRLLRWKAASRMTWERPVAGWGLGAFPVIQSNWTREGDPPAQVLAQGTSLFNIAHSFWVQWAAETGGVGLALQVAALAAFFGTGLGALRGMGPGTRRTLLMGSLAVTAGGVVDAVGSPSYTFPGVSALFWLWVGLGMGVCRRGDAARSLPAASRGVWLVSLSAGLLAALLVLGVGSAQRP